jgi:hypothetical protein
MCIDLSAESVQRRVDRKDIRPPLGMPFFGILTSKSKAAREVSRNVSHGKSQSSSSLTPRQFHYREKMLINKIISPAGVKQQEQKKLSTEAVHRHNEVHNLARK